MKKAYKYGIELETLVNYDYEYKIEDSIVEKKLPYIWKGDGSISGPGEGIEFTTNGPLTYTELDRSVKSFCKILNENEVSVNSSTGFHVHMSNKRFFNAKNLKKIVFLWCSIEDVLMATQPRSRFGNQYCKRLLQKYITETNDLPRAKNELIRQLGTSSRYYALNLASLQLHGTIECRLHSGTVDSTKIMAWVDLLLAVYDYALTGYNHAEVLDLFNTTISDEKIDKVFKMLKLETSTALHFKKRINKFGFDLLTKQQTGAIEAMKLKPKVDKLLKKSNMAQLAYTASAESMRAFTRSLDSGL